MYTQYPIFLVTWTGFVEDDFSMDWGGGRGFRMIQVHYIYCAFYFYYYYISSTSDHQALDPRGSVQSLSRVRLFSTPWVAKARQASLSITISRSSPTLTSIELVMPSSHLILCPPLFVLPPIPPSIRVFSNETTLLMRWPKLDHRKSKRIPEKHLFLLY